MAGEKSDNWIRTFLWGAFSIGAGLMIGYFLELGQKDTAYLAVIILIFYVLFSRWFGSTKDGKLKKKEGKEEMASLPATPGINLDMPENMENDEQRREWLDKFLLKQQDL